MWAVAWYFQHWVILTSVDSDEPVQPPLRQRNSKLCSVSSLTFIEYASDLQRLWSDCAYAQADLRLCWSHITHCWKSHVAAHVLFDCFDRVNNYNSAVAQWYFCFHSFPFIQVYNMTLSFSFSVFCIVVWGTHFSMIGLVLSRKGPPRPNEQTVAFKAQTVCQTCQP